MGKAYQKRESNSSPLSNSGFVAYSGNAEDNGAGLGAGCDRRETPVGTDVRGRLFGAITRRRGNGERGERRMLAGV